MSSKPPSARATSVTRDQTQDHNQIQIRTRSQLALPEFNVEYDRSPLKNAKEALRRANARYGQMSRLAQSATGDDELGDKADAKMNDILSRVNSKSSSNPFRPSGSGKGKDDVTERCVEAMETCEVIAGTPDAENDGTSVPRPSPSYSLVPIEETTSGLSAHRKRARSPSLGESTTLSPSRSADHAGGIAFSRTSPPLSRHTTDNDCGTPISGTDSVSSSSSSGPTPTTITTDTSNAKRTKLGKQGTLDSFLKHSSSSSSSSSSTSQQKHKQVKSLDMRTTPARRTFGEASSRQPPQLGTAGTPRNDKPMQAVEPIVYPKTPTMKELRELPTLDLRTIPPSPQKHAVQFGLGRPGVKQSSKSRAVSEGAAFMLSRSNDEGKEKKQVAAETKDEVQWATSEPHEDIHSRHFDTSHPMTPPASQGPSKEKAEMDVQLDAPLADDADVPTTTSSNASSSITVPTSTTTTTLPASPSEGKLRQYDSATPFNPTQIATQPLFPSTPKPRTLPSGSLPSGCHSPTKDPLSKLLSLSPLTPLSVLAQAQQKANEYDYEEEERSVQEEESTRVNTKQAAKLAMQEEAETDAVSPAPSQVVAFRGASSSKEATSASPLLARKASSKGKQKAKMLSSTSRVATGPIGVKKRKSLVSGTGMTPRTRLTRASVLRQKAIQAQMRTPKDGKRRSSMFHTKQPKSMSVENAEEKKDEESAKEGSSLDRVQKSEQKKPPEPEPQRSPRKTFVLTVPSSLSPRKSGSARNSANSSLTLKSNPLNSGPSKPFTFSLYPPPLNDASATAQAQQALNKLSSALDKLAMPPPSKPNTSSDAQLRRPMSEQRERIRPATSLGFQREMSVPVSGAETGGMGRGRARATSRAGSAEPTGKRSFFPPPPPPAFGSSLMKERGKGKASANASRTVPVAIGASKMQPPSSFRFGLGSVRGVNGIFGRPIPRMRASQKTSLETVQGSPVKGGEQVQGFAEKVEDEIMPAETAGEQRDNDADADASASSSTANGDTSVSSIEGGDTFGPGSSNATTETDGKELKRISKLNASRRASMAFTTLAQSLGTSPDLFSPIGFGSKEPNSSNGSAGEKTPTGASDNDKKHIISTAFSSSSNRPVRAAAPRSFGFGASGLQRANSESAAHGNSRARSVTPAGTSESDTDSTVRGSTKKSGTGRTKLPGSLDVLAQCTVFVDVRTDEGEDAGALFVDMLRGLGARVLTRVGQTCTHIVYKNGLSSTVTRYRLLDEPRPRVVGIAWVVECAEKRARVDESRFQVDLESVNVAGTLKRRRSFLPKQISSAYSSGPMDAFINGTGSETLQVARPVPRACDSDVTSEDGDTSQERAVLSGSSLSSDIHPLERARRRSIMPSR